MDPWYFLDIYLEDNNESLSLNEFTDCSPGGDWIIQCEDYKIIYDNNKYDLVVFNNKTMEIRFYNENIELLRLQLSINKLEIN